MRLRAGQHFVERLWRSVRYEDIDLKGDASRAELRRR
jgi:hypothetical protein